MAGDVVNAKDRFVGAPDVGPHFTNANLNKAEGKLANTSLKYETLSALMDCAKMAPSEFALLILVVREKYGTDISANVALKPFLDGGHRPTDIVKDLIKDLCRSKAQIFNEAGGVISGTRSGHIRKAIIGQSVQVEQQVGEFIANGSAKLEALLEKVGRRAQKVAALKEAGAPELSHVA